MTKTLIRRATAEDFPTLLTIDRNSFPAGIAYDAVELSYFMNRRGAQTLVLEDEGAIAAFLILEIHRNTNTATIITLDVEERYRQRGFATRLLHESEEILKRQAVGAYDLQVDVENVPAIAFYRKHGFESVRVIRAYYSNGHDAYLMIKKFQITGRK
jgi:[ribosomal protein S18]-alanine N-acetyltransferase